MISFSRIEANIPQVTAVLVLVIAICAFCLSFYNLQLQATEAGINPWLSWMWPVCLDCLLIAGSLMVLRSSLRGDSAYVGWSVLLVFTGISTGFNVIHSPADIISRLAHAVPPVSLCVSIELLMLCIKSDLQQPAPSTPVESMQQKQHVTKPSRSSIPGLILEHYAKYPDTSITEAAAVLGLHRSTISRHLKSINASLQEDT